MVNLLPQSSNISSTERRLFLNLLRNYAKQLYIQAILHSKKCSMINPFATAFLAHIYTISRLLEMKVFLMLENNINYILGPYLTA